MSNVKSIKLEYTFQTKNGSFPKGEILEWNPKRLRYESKNGELVVTDLMVKTMPVIFKKYNNE